SREQGDEQSFRQRIQHAANRDLRNGLQLWPDHFAALRSSISFRRAISSASMPFSSRMFNTSCSWEFSKKRPTRWLISERVASSRLTRGAYTWARPSFTCLTYPLRSSTRIVVRTELYARVGFWERESRI